MKQALLISGGIRPDLDYARYAANLALAASALRARGFDDAHMRTCRGSAATRTGVEAAVRELAAAGVRETLVVVTSNHGNRRGLNLWGNDVLTAPELGRILTALPADRVLLIFAQCCGGLMVPALRAPNRVIVTSTSHTEAESAHALEDASHSEFVHHFFTALLPAADGRCPSIAEAFEKAREADTWVAGKLVADDLIGIYHDKETPTLWRGDDVPETFTL